MLLTGKQQQFDEEDFEEYGSVLVSLGEKHRINSLSVKLHLWGSEGKQKPAI